MDRTELVLICTMLHKYQNNKIVSRLLEPLVPRPQYLTEVMKKLGSFNTGSTQLSSKIKTQYWSNYFEFYQAERLEIFIENFS